MIKSESLTRVSAVDAALHYHGDIAARGAAVDFAVNVRRQMPTWLYDDICAGVSDLSPYPSAEEDALVRTAVGSRHGRCADEVLLLNGAAEGFALLPDVAESVTIVHPQFTEPEAAFAAAHKTIQRVILHPPYRLHEDNLEKVRKVAVRGSKSVANNGGRTMLIVGNPTNPTGVLHTRAEILALADLADILVVDEAFMDATAAEAADGAEVASVTAEEVPNLVVLRSMTKTWSIAGLRCGYALGSPELLAELSRRRPHWPLGTLQLRAMAAIARHEAESLPRIRGHVRAERAAMIDMLQAAQWQIFPSQAPFLLVKPPVIHADAAREALAAQSIAVRRCDTFPGLDSSYWRLAVREREQVGKLVAAVAEYAANEKQVRN